MASYDSPPWTFSTCFRLISELLLWVLLLVRVDAQTQTVEVRALLSFRAQNVDLFSGYSNGYWISWNEDDENPCAWFGVTCTTNNTVSELDLSDWGFGDPRTLVGLDVLSPLTDLRRLDMSSNSMIVIPDDIGALTGLTWLDLSNNKIRDGIPRSIAGCQNLRFISLEQNYLVGDIRSLGTLVNLQFLLLAHNEFTGPFPKELGELSNLVILDLSDNLLFGTIPALPKLTNLVQLKLDRNKFTGFEEPWSLNAIRTLEHLSLSNNQIQGQIPFGIRNLSNLEVLDLSQNQLFGNISSELTRQFRNKHLLDLSQNQLTGEIPAGLYSYAYLNLSHNLLGGDISVEGAEPSVNMVVLDLSHNKLSGPIPSIFGKPDFQINTLCLQNNHLSGDIVAGLVRDGALLNVTILQLQNNLLTGDLSRLANTTWKSLVYDSYDIWPLQILDLSYNRLIWSTSSDTPDPIKTTLLALTSKNVQELRFGGNDASGTSLPATCFLNDSVRQFRVLDLSNSHLQGWMFDAAFNKSCLPAVVSVNLSNNDIAGRYPEIILTLTDLVALDVSNNHLSGSLPAFPLGSSLSNPSFYAGNDGLCGYPLPACIQHVRKTDMQWWVLVIIGGSLTVSVLSCLAAIWRWRVYLKRHQQDADLIKTLMERDSATLMPLRDLKSATGNFATSARIGEGGFGTVYRGKLNDGTIVAIKRSKREGSEIDKQLFLNEVRILSHVNHRNLVKLLGCCMENKIAVLVFEFVSNGTLQEHLRSRSKPVRLSWMQRLNIAVQTADALNYLHSAATFPIYHRDVKSANILLDEELNAKVADFGMSKLVPHRATHVSTIAIQGTMGYIDPEYCSSNQLTAKSDVYSFGMVLLELLSAQSPIDFRRGEEEISLATFAGPHIESGDLHGLVDPALLKTYNDPSGYGRESMMNFGRLAMKCLDARSKARPRMNQVLQELRELWLDTNDSSKNFFSSSSEDVNLGDYCKFVLPKPLTVSFSTSFATPDPDDLGVSKTLHNSYFTTESNAHFKTLHTSNCSTESNAHCKIQMTQISHPTNFTNRTIMGQ